MAYSIWFFAATLSAPNPLIDQMEETKEGPLASGPPLPSGPLAAAAAAAEPVAQPVQVAPLDEIAAYDAATEAKILMFYKKRKGKKFKDYAYSAAGDLVIKEAGKEGDINLKRFLPLTAEEQAALDQLRQETLAAIEADLANAYQTLHDAHESYKVSKAIGPVLAANQAVAELDARRNAIRSGVRTLNTLYNPVTREILLDQPYETRKLISVEKGAKDPFMSEVWALILREYAPTRLFGKYVVDEAVPAAAGEVATESKEPGPDELTYRQKLADGRIARIFFKGDEDMNGFLSPFWPVEFNLDATRYFTALQAYEAERMRELNKEDVRTALLRTRSAATVRILARKIEGEVADPRSLWLRIFTAVYQQHPELQEKLLATGTDTLVYADEKPGPSGTGVAPTAPAILKPAAWKGENVVGVALETLRTRLREGTLEEAPVEEEEEGVISEAEQEAARVGAIINNARRR